MAAAVIEGGRGRDGGQVGGKQRKPVFTGPWVVRGEVFPDAQSVAQRFGVSVTHVRLFMRKGKGDALGLIGPTVRKLRYDTTRVKIRGVQYESPAAAAAALGVKRGTIYTHLRRGTIDKAGIGTGNGGSNESKKVFTNAKPVCIGAYSWPSISAAARDMQCRPQRVRRALQSGNIEPLLGRLMKREAERCGHLKD